MKMKLKPIYSLLLIFSCLSVQAQNNKKFTFAVTADMRNYTGDNPDFFRGVCESIATHENVPFMVSPGDIDPPDSVIYTIRKYTSKDMIWYPVVGNHEIQTPSDMEWLRNYNKGGYNLPNIVNAGPASCLETTYSFDYKNSHFIILNQYCSDSCDDCTNGNINDLLYNWLKNDLGNTRKNNIFVFGHEPAYPLPDMQNQRFRHPKDCLNQFPENRDRFIQLLRDHHVKAFLVGHTHDYSTVKIKGIWQIDVGHSRGKGDPGARSTYVLITVSGKKAFFSAYRLNDNGQYELTDNGMLD